MKFFLTLLFYRCFLFILTPVIILLLLVRSRSNKTYRQRLNERFGFLKGQYKKDGIVIHAASVGEVLALRNLVEELLITYPNIPITFTTFTPTGSEQVKKLFGERVQHCYLPLDIFFSTHLFLSKIRPQVIIFMETELWPNLVAQAKYKNIKLLLVNGRISSASINSYKKMRWLIAPCLQRFDKILSQSADNHANFLALGATSKQRQISGNLKYDMVMSSEITVKQAELAGYIPKNKILWIMASTHEGDEEIAFSALKNIHKKHPEVLLAIVPRHPERFGKVIEMAQAANFSTKIRSKKESLDESTQVWVIDTLGELMSLYGLADIVSIGGSFSHIGGHNPLEPAWFNKPIIVGPNMENFHDILQQMLDAQGLIQLHDEAPASKQLSATISHLIKCPNEAKKFGKKAHKIVMLNQGALVNTLEEIANHIQIDD